MRQYGETYIPVLQSCLLDIYEKTFCQFVVLHIIFTNYLGGATYHVMIISNAKTGM